MHVTHEDDVVEAFWLALKRGAEGAFNIATEDPLPISQWPKQMGKWAVPIPGAILGVADLAWKLKLSDLNPVWLKAGSEFPIVVSANKARKQLRWRPRYDTTGQVLRAFAAAPTAVASPGTKLLFGLPATVTRFRGSLPLGQRGSDEMRGMEGIANIVFTGDHPSEWRVEFKDGTMGIRRGIDPIRIAERIATLDILSGGRVNWGSGKSASLVEQLAFENDLSQLHEQWLEALDMIPRMWQSDVFEDKGKFFEIPPTQVIPKPVQQPHPPIFAACSKPSSAVPTRPHEE